MGKESRTRNTNNYKGMGIMLLCISLFVGFIILFAGETIPGIIIICSGITLFFTFIFMYSICYRLDLLIDKK
jgi:hypothetical protein